MRGLAWRRIAGLRTNLSAISRRAKRTSEQGQELGERAFEQVIRNLGERGVPIPRALRGIANVPASEEEDSRLRRAIASVAEESRGPLVSVIVLGGGKPPEGLDSTAYEPWELVAGEELPDAIRRCKGELILLLDEETEPIGAAWLAAMVAALRRCDAACVGTRLVHPRRPTSRRVSHPDLSLAHRGLHFPPGPGLMPMPARLGAGESPFSPSATAEGDVPAVSAACMLAEKSALEALDLPRSSRSPDALGAEISIRLRESGGRVVYAPSSVAFHPGEDDEAGKQELNDRVGPLLFRRALADRLRGGRAWTRAPLRVGITVTRDSERFGHGDQQVASELGAELEGLGWEVVRLELHRGRWRNKLAGLDVLLVLLDRFPLEDVPRGVVSVAWIRNWTERWIERPWFDDFDLVFTSSSESKRLVDERSSKVAKVMPLAVNPSVFTPSKSRSASRADVLFAGNRWGVTRDVEAALGGLPEDRSVRVLGRGWEESPALRSHASGWLDYEQMPVAYASATVVVDDSAAHAKPYGAVNARVFEALACGSPVVSNDAKGVRELFDDDFPVWDDPDSLRRQVEAVHSAPERSRELTDRYRRVVLERHTYRHRAVELRDALLAWVAAPRVGIAVGVPSRTEVETWGDFHFARGLARSFERREWPARVHLLADWKDPHAARDDVCLHLFGLSPMTPRPGQVTAIWIISHPELVSPELCLGYDVAFAASGSFAAELTRSGAGTVEALPQATDPVRFRPGSQPIRFELLFVGNSLGRDRSVVRAAARSGHRLSVFGRGWTPELIDPIHVAGTEVPNSDLHRFYSEAAIVLNDHWPEMREHGFISNRVYDALASGACVVSDDVEGMNEHFDGAVATFAGERELHELLDRLLAHPSERTERAARGRRAVLARHTFDARADQLLGQFEELLKERHGPSGFAQASSNDTTS